MFFLQLLPILAFIVLLAWGVRSNRLDPLAALAFILVFLVLMGFYVLADWAIVWAIALLVVLDIVLASVVFVSDTQKG